MTTRSDNVHARNTELHCVELVHPTKKRVCGHDPLKPGLRGPSLGGPSLGGPILFRPSLGPILGGDQWLVQILGGGRSWANGWSEVEIGRS